MCQFNRSNSFEFQDTLLRSRYTSNGFSPVDGKFIQIVNPNNNHWVFLFNALTFIREPHVVEIFDSLRTPKLRCEVRTVRTFKLVVRYVLNKVG